MKWLILPLLLAGCTTAPQIVQVPLPVRCIEALPARPALVTDEDLKAMSDGQMVLALRQYHLSAGGYILELEAVARPCTKEPLSYSPPPAGG